MFGDDCLVGEVDFPGAFPIPVRFQGGIFQTLDGAVWVFGGRIAQFHQQRHLWFLHR